MALRVTRLRFDSDILGMSCGRLEVSEDTCHGKRLSDVVSKAWSEGMEHLTVRIPSEWSSVPEELRSHQFRFVLCSLSFDKRVRAQTHGDPCVRVYDGEHDARLRDITCGAFTGNTRFHLEPAFAVEKVRLLHERWIQNLVEDDSVRVFVHRDGEVITGYVTVRVARGVQNGHIGLIAVDRRYRGRHIGGRLLQSAECAMGPPVRKLSVMTESMNTRAVRLYTRAGYSVRKSWGIWQVCRQSDYGDDAQYGRERS